MFAEDYKRMKEIYAQFEAAEDVDDTTGMDAARKAYHEFDSALKEKGQAYCKFFSMYKMAMDRGNTYIFLSATTSDAEECVKNMRTFGIEKFVLGSEYSRSAETAYAFQESGCRLEKVVEINSGHKKIMSKEYEKTYGFLFSLN